ncbi:MAG: bifunctional oligoribonuclease/PAP phosphatase NrnA [Muribaculaceae bacterium]|nr:bifunctional oligoribonuclease/PAP phosphatase NrnA [Muribaculaceae bacterium]
MIQPILDSSKIKNLRKLLESNDNIAITCHISPDGDAIGSSLGLAHVLSAIGKEVKVVTPDTAPKNLMFLPGADDIVVCSKYEEFANELLTNAQIIFAVDFNDTKRIDRLATAFNESKAHKVMIDHHLFPQDFAEISFSHPDESSSAMLVFRTLCQLGLFSMIDKNAAMCLYTGMMTDTGNFSYNSNEPDLYIVISELLKKGINKDEIYSQVYNSNTANRLRINGFALNEKMQIFDEHRAALITLTRDELNRFEYQKGYVEGLVNQPLSIPEIVYSFFLREEEDHIHVSARSKGEFPVNTICETHYNGGGHKNASGGKLFCTMDEAIKKFKSLLKENDKYLS